jgi:hypothetical protein
VQDPDIGIHKNGDTVSVSITFHLTDSTDDGECSATYCVRAVNDEDNDCVEIEVEDEQQFEEEKSVYQNVLPESRLA